MAQTWQTYLHSFAVETFRLSVWLMLLAAIFVPLERLFALHPEKIFRKAIATDLFYYFLSSLVPIFVLGIPLGIIAQAAHMLVPGAFLDMMAHLPAWIRIPAVLVVGEIGFYWGHRWSHQIPFLWRFHAVHHSAEHMDFLVNTRAHPFDIIFTRLCGFVPLFVLGLAGPGGGSSATPLLLLFVATIWGFFIHSNLRWRFGPLEHLVSTPAFHHWHHTRREHVDRNYASLFPWVDHLFGSFHLPPKQWPGEYGTDTPVGPGIAGQVFDPLINRQVAPGEREAVRS